MLSMTPQGSGRSASTSSADFAKVDLLLERLQQNLGDAQLSLKQQEDLLSQVKTCGRDAATAGPIFSSKGVAILSQYGLDKSSTPVANEALKCLANAFLLHEPSRQDFVDQGFAPKAAEKLKLEARENQFLLSRMLFLLTYNTKLDFEELVKSNSLAETINRHVAHHAKVFRTSGRRKSNADPMEDMALIETLKLLFNITYYYPDLISSFTPSIEPLLQIVVHHKMPTPPLQPPITYCLNALLNLDLKSVERKTPFGPESKTSPLFPYKEPESVLDKLMSILNSSMATMPESELDQAAAPLCTLLQRIYTLATPQIRSFMRWILLPNDKDRDKPLGKGDTLASRLLRASCSPGLPTLRENISNLLFELSDRDANKFVKNIGFGFASGFLMSNNIDIPKNASEAGSTADDDAGSAADINPVTGQRFDSEDRDAPKQTPMTEAEKEREAERLFVLFERLNATGVVDVKNPVRQAMEEGRFEELDD